MAEDDDDLFMFSGAQPVRFGSSLEATSEQEDAIKKLLNEGSMVNDGDYEETPTARRARKRTASGRREEFVELLTTGQVVDSPKKEKEEKKYDKHDELNELVYLHTLARTHISRGGHSNWPCTHNCDRGQSV